MARHVFAPFLADALHYTSNTDKYAQQQRTVLLPHIALQVMCYILLVLGAEGPGVGHAQMIKRLCSMKMIYGERRGPIIWLSWACVAVYVPGRKISIMAR